MSNSHLDHFEDDVDAEEPQENFLWAVSYADMLMVLMSFFIVYFSFDPEKSPELIQQLSMGISKTSENYKIDNNQSSTPKGMNEIQRTLGERFHTEYDPKSPSFLTINLEDNIFELGRSAPNQKVKKQILDMLSLIKPFEGKVNLFFIGHSDGVLFKYQHSNNLYLSNLRATAAAEFALNSGLNPKYVRTTGYAEFGRGTRSLSVRLEERQSN